MKYLNNFNIILTLIFTAIVSIYTCNSYKLSKEIANYQVEKHKQITDNVLNLTFTVAKNSAINSMLSYNCDFEKYINLDYFPIIELDDISYMHDYFLQMFSTTSIKDSNIYKVIIKYNTLRDAINKYNFYLNTCKQSRKYIKNMNEDNLMAIYTMSKELIKVSKPFSTTKVEFTFVPINSGLKSILKEKSILKDKNAFYISIDSIIKYDLNDILKRIQ